MIQALPTLIAAGESQTLEFKATFDKDCIATLVAFVNAQGKTVVAICIGEFPVKPVNTGGYLSKIHSFACYR